MLIVNMPLTADCCFLPADKARPSLALSALPKELLELPTLTTFGLVAVFLAVWGATDAVRPGQKFVGALFLSGNKS